MTIHAIETLRAPRRDPADSVRAAMWSAYLRSVGERKGAESLERSDDVARSLLAPPIMRADAAPLATGVAGGGAELLQSAVASYISTLQPLSAAAGLFGAAARFNLGPTESVAFPINSSVPASPPWTAEGDPLPVIGGSFTDATLGPTKKLGFIVPVTRELAKRANGRRIFDAMIREVMASVLDAAVFSATAASAAAHRGLRDGVVPVASSGDIVADAAALLGAVADAGGGGDTVLILSPTEHAQAQLRLPAVMQPKIWATRGLPQGVALAIDLPSFASGTGELEIFAASDAVLHMENTVPLEIVSGAPATADPVRSFYQSGSLAIRAILDVAFVSRGDKVSVMESVAW